MALKPPSPQNLAKRKKFFMEHLDYPNAIPELKKIFKIELERLWDKYMPTPWHNPEYIKAKEALIKEGRKNCDKYEKLNKGKSEMIRLA